MGKVSRSEVILWLLGIGLMALGARPAQAQYFGSSSSGLSSGSMPSYRFSSAGSYFSGSSTYVPFGGAMGGFIPYGPGPGGGLGVQPGMRDRGRGRHPEG